MCGTFPTFSTHFSGENSARPGCPAAVLVADLFRLLAEGADSVDNGTAP